MTTTRRNDRVRQLLLGLLCTLLSLVLLTAILIVRHHYFVRGLFGYAEMTSADYEPPVFPRLSDREVANLGWAHSETRRPDSSYINFPEEKRPGVIRIGTFGDSHTAGSEVAVNHDYPSFLQRRFDAAGYHDVEVVNFGVASYGVHQSYLMWTTLGEKYDIDIAVFLTFPFHINRDSTFIKHPRSFGGVHARYVLRDGDAEIVEVLGGDRIEASAGYFGLIPALRYLRYDRRPSPYLRALIPDARSLDFNPLYYETGMDLGEETRATYSILFERWADEVGSLVITTPTGEFYDDLAGLIASPRVHLLESQFETDTGSTLYRAPGWHPSALGNDVRAEELFSFLTGRENPEPRVFRLRSAPTSGERRVGDLGPLSRFARVSVGMMGMPVAAFVERKHVRDLYLLGDDLDFAEDRVWSLLQVPGGKAVFVPVPFPLADGASVSIEFELGGEPVEVSVGRVEAGADILGRVVLEESEPNGDLVKKGDRWSMNLSSREELLGVRFKAEVKVRAPRLLVDGQPILVGKRPRFDDRAMKRGGGRRYRLTPIDADYVFLRAKAGQFPDLDSLHGARGGLEMVLEDDDGRQLRHSLYLDFDVQRGERRPFGEPYTPAVSRAPVRDRG